MRESSPQEIDARREHLDSTGQFSPRQIEIMVGAPSQTPSTAEVSPPLSFYASSVPLEPESMRNLIENPDAFTLVEGHPRTNEGAQAGIQKLRNVIESSNFQKNLTRNQNYGNE